MVEVDQVTEPCTFHGEGPVWHDGWGGLRIVDQLAGDVVFVDVTTGTSRHLHVDSIVAAIRPRKAGGMVVAIERGFAFVSDNGTIERLGDLWDHSQVRMNEGGCDPDGRFYCGSLAADFSPGGGKIYRLDVDGTVTVTIDPVSLSNGMAWSPDGGTVYYIDTETQRVDAFDYDPEAGIVADSRRPLVDLTETNGSPDGMTVDAEGFLWVAMWGDSSVLRISPDGKLDGRIEFPVSHVSACTFGGSDLGDLYVATSRLLLPEDAEPDAGSVYRVRPGVTGLPTLPYAG